MYLEVDVGTQRKGRAKQFKQEWRTARSRVDQGVRLEVGGEVGMSIWHDHNVHGYAKFRRPLYDKGR